MIEKAIAGLWGAGRAWSPLVKRRAAVLPPGAWVAAATLLLVGGRALWVAGSRPPHREEIAAAFGSVCSYGNPEMDAAGGRLCYGRRSKIGAALFLLDLRTGEKQEVARVEQGSCPRAFGWAPDGRKFVYLDGGTLYVGPGARAGAKGLAPGHGKPVTGLVWLNAEHFVCVANGRICHVRERQGQLELLADYPPGDGAGEISGLNAVGTNAVAWLKDNRVWRLELDAGPPAGSPAAAQAGKPQNSPTLWLDPQRREVDAMSYSAAAGALLFSCAGARSRELWEWRPEGGPGSLTRLCSEAVVVHPLWAGKDRYAFVTRYRGQFCVALGSRQEPELRKLPIVSGNWFSVTPDGSRLVIAGQVGNDIGTGIWQCDCESGNLQCLVPCTDRPSPAAAPIATDIRPFDWPGGGRGNVSIVRPVGFDRRAHRKYPVVIGNTCSDRPPWVDALANCGCFVVVVQRSSWWPDIEKWSERILAVYPSLAADPAMDLDRAFLFAQSAETQYLAKLLTDRPELWEGAILVNPGVLPDLAAFPLTKPVPKLLISYGELEGQERFRRYQEDAVKRGVGVECVVHRRVGHGALPGTDAMLERTRAIVRFISDD